MKLVRKAIWHGLPLSSTSALFLFSTPNTREQNTFFWINWLEWTTWVLGQRGGPQHTLSTKQGWSTWVKSQPSYRETLCRETETGGREKGNNIFLLNFKITLWSLKSFNKCKDNCNIIWKGQREISFNNPTHRKNSPKQSQEIILYGYSQALGIICSTGNNFVQSIPKR